MSFFRPRRASTYVLSGLTLTLLLNGSPRPSFAQTAVQPAPYQPAQYQTGPYQAAAGQQPAAQPANASQPNNGSAQSSDQFPVPSAPPSAVQRQLIKMYERDGRPVPEYLTRSNACSDAQPQQYPAAPQNGNSQNANSQPAATAQYPVSQYPASQYPASQYPSNPYPATNAPAQAPQPARAVPGSIQQQLADYYSSQGKPYPAPQSSYNAPAVYQQAAPPDYGASQRRAIRITRPRAMRRNPH